VAEPGQTRKEQRVAAREERMQAEAARARQRRRLWQLGGALGLATVVVIAVVIALGSRDDDGKKQLRSGETLAGQFEANERFEGIPQKGVALGDPDAPVTLVEFADLQCPFCMRYTLDVMPTLVAKYVKTGQVRMIFRDVAFLGTDSVRAQQMAAAAGRQNKLWQFIDIFYNNQGDENTGYVDDPFLRKIGNAVDGLDVEKAFDDRGTASVQRQLVEAQQEWQSYGLSGTPSFVMGPTDGDYEPVLRDNEGPTLELMSERIDAALKGAT
jgi:protein-disulfide isomerase